MLSTEHAMQVCNGYISTLETFGLVDGPGVRFVVFLQGCNMRCKYCHNPETWQIKTEETKIFSPKELIEHVWKYRFYWGKNMTNGGLTVSGGEPLLQIDFLIQLFSLAKEKGIHTTIDTCGQPFSMDEEFISKFNALMEVTDLFIVDIKAFDSKLHKSLTGHNNENILEMIKYLSDNNKKMWIRHVLVPDLTDDENDLINTKNFISTLKTVERVEILPYHTLGLSKWKKLNIEYPLKDKRLPTQEEIERAENLIGATKK